ncbi:MAG: class I tRNA ligase family protein, partial [Arenicellales bacterium]
KSKGNVLDPIDLIDGIELEALLKKRTEGMMQPHLREKIAQQTKDDFPDGIVAYGTDALRFTFAAMATNGRDINFSTGRIEGYRNFCNKIWNAARFVLMNTEGKDCATDHDNYELTTVDHWVISRLQYAESEVVRGFEAYRFDRSSTAIYEFIWNEYCDWYLELTKPVLNSDDTSDAIKAGTRRTLLRVLETAMRLAHPIMPYITEEIWQKIAPLAGKSGDTIMRASYPIFDASKQNTEAETSIQWVQAFILSVRKIRGEMNIAPGKPLAVFLVGASVQDKANAEEHLNLLQFIGRISDLTILDNEADAPESAVAMMDEMKLMIPLAGLIDKDAELSRLEKEIEKAEANIARTRGKLSNASFTDKAPELVVEKEREKLAQGETLITNLNIQLEKIKTM